MTDDVWFLGLVAGLATARVTRLIVADEITSPIRRVAHRLDPQTQHIGFLVTCPYCTGVWAAAGVLGLMTIAVQWDHRGRWLAATPVAIMAAAQAGLWLTPQGTGRPDTGATYTAPWPKED